MGTPLKDSQLVQVLKSLLPTTTEEVTWLRWLVTSAQVERSGSSAPSDLGMDWQRPNPGLSLAEVISSLPQEAIRYFHGLLEALEVYRSIHQAPVPVERLSVGDPLMHELRQIRDYCLDEGLRSIY